MPFQTAITLVVLFLTHCLGGVAAFGSALLALPVLLLVGWDLRAAVATLLLVGTVQALHMTWLNWRWVDRRALARILIVAGIGVPIGFLTARMLPERGLGIALGFVLTVAGASRLAEHWTQTQWRPPGWGLQSLLFAGGVIHGAFGSGGATLTVYARYALPEKSRFRGPLSVMWVVLNTAVLVGLFADGAGGRDVATAAALGAPAVLLATWLGNRLAARLSQERFADVVAGLLCLAGLVTIVRNVL